MVIHAKDTATTDGKMMRAVGLVGRSDAAIAGVSVIGAFAHEMGVLEGGIDGLGGGRSAIGRQLHTGIMIAVVAVGCRWWRQNEQRLGGVSRQCGNSEEAVGWNVGGEW